MPARLIYWPEPFKPRTLARSRWRQTVDDKPEGLWYSVGADWERWCRGSGFRLNQLRYVHELRLTQGARILHLRTAKAILDFAKRYRATSPPPLYTLLAGILTGIDWPRVASEYQGIEIAPYQASLRTKQRWYYTWDAASGCVWDKKAITSIAPREHATVGAA